MILIDYLRFNPLDGEENSRKSNLVFFFKKKQSRKSREHERKS